MNVIRNFTGTAVLLAGLVAAGASQASVIDFDGSMVNLGTVAAGQTGVITDSYAPTALGPYEFATTSFYGFLPTDDQITFTYTYSGMMGASQTSYGSYQYTSSGSTFSGNSYSVSGSAPVSTGTVNGAASAPLVLAAADLNSALTTGATSASNTSTGTSQFQSQLVGLFNPNGRIVSVSYAVSAVPLPAALPMFATVLAGLVGFSLLRKRRPV